MASGAGMSERPTMVDVARLAGVSLKTVSRVVNHEAGVRPETESRVRGAVEALGYRANDIARNLRRGRPSATIGLVIEDVRNPFYSAVARAVEQVARDHGYVVVIANSDEDAAGARQAAEHLLARGHRRIALVADSPDIVTIAERLSGYRRTVEAAGLTVDETLIRTGLHDVRDAEAATVRLLALSDPPTAIFATNNRGCVGALRALHVRSEERSRAALVGFDDFELADLLQVTVVRHDPHEMGRWAADLLFARLSGDEQPPQRVVLPTEPVVRASKETSP